MSAKKISAAISRAVNVGHVGKANVPEQPLDLPRELYWSETEDERGIKKSAHDRYSRLVSSCSTSEQLSRARLELGKPKLGVMILDQGQISDETG